MIVETSFQSGNVPAKKSKGNYENFVASVGGERKRETNWYCI